MGKPVIEKSYIRNGHLPTVKKDYPGNLVINGQFANGDKLYAPGFADVLKWRLTPNPQKEEKQKDPFQVPVKPEPGVFNSTEDMIVWLGHATFLIRLGGTTFLTDPILYDLPLIRRKTEFPYPEKDIVNIDYLLLSHGHRDHLDKKSVQTLCRRNPHIQALAPLQMGPLLKKFAPDMPFQEAGWFQQFALPDSNVQVYFTPARHLHRRGLTDVNKVLWGSFVLRTNKTSIYFAGDTATGEHFDEIFDLFEPDYCLLPVGAYKPPFLMQKSHLNPHEAVKAFNQLRGHTFIPMHYGTFDLSDEPPGEPVRLLEQIAASGQLYGSLLFPAIGEKILIQ